MRRITSLETVPILCLITCLRHTGETGTTCLPGNRNTTPTFVPKGPLWKDPSHFWSLGFQGY